jgi:hypothetical protein
VDGLGLNFLFGGACVVDEALRVASEDGFLHETHMVEKQLLEVVGVDDGGCALEFEGLGLQKPLSSFFLFLNEALEVAQLLLASGDLVGAEVVVQLSCEDIVA